MQITLRGDAHFSTPEVHDLCDEYGLAFILGQAVNRKLKALGATADGAGSRPGGADRKAGCGSLHASIIRPIAGAVRARSSTRPRLRKERPTPRFVVTNIRNRTPRFLYEKVYCARGRSEGFIKNHKTFLNSDRTSCHRFPANQFRLFLHSAAYVLVHAIKHIGMRGTQWTTSNFDTIQLRVLKIGARVREQTTTVRLSLSDVISAQGLDEVDRLQPRHRVMRTMTTHHKIDHQHDPRDQSVRRKCNTA